MKYAIIKTKGSQFRVAEGDEIDFPRFDLEAGAKIKFDQVLLLVDEGRVEVGQPILSNVVVEGEVIDQHKGEKVRVANFRAKSRYRRVKGFRAQLTKIKINKIITKKKAA